jgi:molecular chaperone GrpE
MTKEENKKEENLNEEEIQVEEKHSKKEKKALDKAEEKIASLEEEVKTWKNKYYEAYADMDNLRKKMDKDHEVMYKYRGQGFLEALLPTFDNFYNCFKYKPEDPKLMAYCQGFEMIYNQMLTAIESEGVKEFIPEIGSEFDSAHMMAVDVIEGEENNKVVRVVNKGYYLKDRLVRAAGVVVSKKKETKEETKENDEIDSSKVN